MPFRIVFRGIAILILVSGLFLFATSAVREIHDSTISSGGNDYVPSGEASYGGATAPFSNPTQLIVGSSGIADLMILTTPWHDFDKWLCDHKAPCNGNNFNITTLNTYLQTNKAQIAYSQTIIDQNVSLTSLPYHVTSLTDVTIVLVPLGSGYARVYWSITSTNLTTSYPLLGYTEQSGSTLSLPNISLDLIITGVVTLVVLRMGPLKLNSSIRPNRYRGSTTRKCFNCGGENLFFAKRCAHCGRALQETPMVEAR